MFEVSFSLLFERLFKCIFDCASAILLNCPVNIQLRCLLVDMPELRLDSQSNYVAHISANPIERNL